jgi:hypothetical protein
MKFIISELYKKDIEIEEPTLNEAIKTAFTLKNISIRQVKDEIHEEVKEMKQKYDDELDRRVIE